MSSTLKFDSYHGSNIQLAEGGTVAIRKLSFAQALVFSERPLRPGEIFLLEIVENDRGWNGYMRLGLTQHDPATRFRLPQFALPDLLNMGKSWIFALSSSDHEPCQSVTANFSENPDVRYLPMSSGDSFVLGNAEYMITSSGVIPRTLLRPCAARQQRKSLVSTTSTDGAACSSTTDPSLLEYLFPDEDEHNSRDRRIGETGAILPTDVGSRLGILYLPSGPQTVDMIVVVNGVEYVFASGIPRDQPLRAVVDVYGRTKVVRIIQLYEHAVPTLQSVCRDSILKHISQCGVATLPLPPRLKQYLGYEAHRES